MKQISDFEKDQNLDGYDFTKSQLSGSSFKGIEIKNSIFAQLNIKGCNFNEICLYKNLFTSSNLQKSIFTYARILESIFNNAKLQGCNFFNSYLSDNNFIGSNLERAIFTDSTITKCNFNNAKLKRCDFSRNSLHGNSFAGANLQDANFSFTRFDNFNFQSAKLQGVDFTGCDIWKIILEGLESGEINLQNDENWNSKYSYYLDYLENGFSGAEYDDHTKFGVDDSYKDIFEKFLQNKIGLIKKKRATNSSLRSNKQTNIKQSNNQSQIIVIKTIEKSINSRLGQSKFRNDLLKEYQETCAITGEKVPGLEAAHIKPHSVCEDSEKLDPKNGLLLRADIHTLFDLGLIDIEPESYLLKIDDRLKGSCYEDLNDTQLYSVENHIYTPGKDFLEWRWREYKKIAESVRDKFISTSFNHQL